MEEGPHMDGWQIQALRWELGRFQLGHFLASKIRQALERPSSLRKGANDR